MNTAKKVLNVFGIIIAWLLSIVLVVVLFVTPVTLSALSTIQPEKITDTMSEVDISEIVGMFEGIDTDDEQLKELLSTNTVQDLYEVYIEDLTGTLNDETYQKTLTDEKIKEIVHNNIDELYQIALAKEPNLSLLPEADAKAQVETMFADAIIELAAELPSAESLKQELVGDSQEVQVAFDILAMVDTIKMAIVGVIVVLCGLIFVCRLPEFRGVRWLSVDLFVGSGFAGLTCVAINLGKSLIDMLVESVPFAAGLVQEFADAFTMGVYIRTGIMLVSAVGLLVLYLFIKKARAKKAAVVVTEEPAVVETPEPEQSV